jgi:hypothetical protein
MPSREDGSPPLSQKPSDHGEEGLGLEEALIVTVFKSLEEDLYNR